MVHFTYFNKNVKIRRFRRAYLFKNVKIRAFHLIYLCLFRLFFVYLPTKKKAN